MAGTWLVCQGGPAHASYTEAHQTGDDVRIRLDTAGHAHVEHTLQLRIVAGQKRTFDLVGVEPGAVPEARVVATGEDERELTGVVSARAGASVPTLVVTMDDPKALRKGKYRLTIGYDLDLLAEHALVRDGSMWRVTWKAPVAPEGYDGARVVFDLPGAATEPRAVRPDADVPDQSVLSSLRRDVERDELELERPHVARGDASVWSVLLSPHALSGLRMDPVATPRPPVPPAARLRLLAEVALLAALGAVFGATVHRKLRVFGDACGRAGTVLNNVLPLPGSLRAIVAGVTFAAGLGVQLAGYLELGSILVAVAMLSAAVTARAAPPRARGPGHWLAMRPPEAFGQTDPDRAVDPLDVGTRRGVATFVVACGILAAVGQILRFTGFGSPYLALVDGLVLVPLFWTGRRVELPPTVSGLGRSLRPLCSRLSKNPALRVAPWARVPQGAHHPDEVRVLVLPRSGMPGLIGIEIGVATGRMSRQYATAFEILVRVQEASAAQARMTTLLPRLIPVTGRRPEERVYRLAARFPTSGWTRALVDRLAGELFDKRKLAVEWTGGERRLPPAAKAQKSQEAA